MESDVQILMEIGFNLCYLLYIWIIVVLMAIKLNGHDYENKTVLNRFLLAFFLLALGDSGHVGFRIIAYINGGFEVNSTLIGFGALSTSITITFFYMIFFDIWRIRFNNEKNTFYYVLMAMGIFRFIIMLFPQNEWGNIIAPFEWSLVRNVPLAILGLITAVLMIFNGFKYEDIRYRNFGYCIVISYAFYIPVILLVQSFPLIGMLMIPKTISYMILAYLAYKYYYRKEI